MPIFTGKSQKFLQRRFFLITNTATSRNELYFYHTSDFQRLVSSKFKQMQKDLKIKEISSDTIAKLNENFQFCSVLARCRLFNKSSLESTRLHTFIEINANSPIDGV